LASTSEIKPLSGMKVYSPSVSMSFLALEKKPAALVVVVGGGTGVTDELLVALARFNEAASEWPIEIKRVGDRRKSNDELVEAVAAAAAALALALALALAFD